MSCGRPGPLLVICTTISGFAPSPSSSADNDTRLPAGSYTVRTVGDENDVLWIESADGKRRVTTQTIAYSPRETSETAQLVFEKFDDQYFLSRIAPDGGEAREIILTPARMEREIQAIALNP